MRPSSSPPPTPARHAAWHRRRRHAGHRRRVRPLRLALAAAMGLAGFSSALLPGRLEAPAAGHGFVLVGGLVLLFAGLGFWGVVSQYRLKTTSNGRCSLPWVCRFTWMLLAGSRALTGFPPWGLMFPLWVVLVVVVLRAGGGLVPGPVRRLWPSHVHRHGAGYHGSAHFGTARDAARHLAPAAPANAFACSASCAMHRAAPIAGCRRMLSPSAAPDNAGGPLCGRCRRWPGQALAGPWRGGPPAAQQIVKVLLQTPDARPILRCRLGIR